MKERKRESEGTDQQRTLTYSFLCDGHTDRLIVHVSELVVGVWDGLDECEIEMLSQSTPSW